MLQKGEGEHRHECMAVKALPGSPFEVVEPKFLFQLLMGLLANPSSLDSGSQGAQIGRSGQMASRPNHAEKPYFAGLFVVRLFLTYPLIAQKCRRGTAPKKSDRPRRKPANARSRAGILAPPCPRDARTPAAARPVALPARTMN